MNALLGEEICAGLIHRYTSDAMILLVTGTASFRLNLKLLFQMII